jgi:hypothetical protein
VLENIIGKRFEFSRDKVVATDDCIVKRRNELATDGLRTYVSPHRARYQQCRLNSCYGTLAEQTTTVATTDGKT